MNTKTKRKKKKRLLWIGITTLVLLSCVLLFPIGYSYYKNYYACKGVAINPFRYAVRGIDVSAHQDKIDWAKVYGDNIKFCFIKATEGEDFVDKRYKENYLGAKQNSIMVGAYHFFRFSSSGKAQALNFINNVAIEKLDLPPVLDVEKEGNYFSFSKDNKIKKEMKEYLDEIERQYNVKPIIYTNIEGYKRYIKGSFDSYQIWICRICDEPKENTWTFWQYSHQGIVKGIDTKVDLNTFNGSYLDFLYYTMSYKQKNNFLN